MEFGPLRYGTWWILTWIDCIGTKPVPSLKGRGRNVIGPSPLSISTSTDPVNLSSLDAPRPLQRAMFNCSNWPFWIPGLGVSEGRGPKPNLQTMNS